MDRYCLPATAIHTLSHVRFFFLTFDFSIVPYMRLLFQLKGQYFFANDKTMNYLCIYVELSFRSGPP